MNIVDASVSAKTNAREELYDRFTSSSVKLKFVAGRSRVEVVLGCPETAELMAALADPFPAPQLELLSMLEVREPRLRQSFCIFMGCVKVVCPEQLTNGRMVGEVRLLDETSDTVIVKLWESEQIRMAASWEPRDTVIFAANVMVEFDSYRGINVLAGSSRSVLTVQPSLWDAAAVGDHARRVYFTPMDRLNTFVAGSHSLAATRLVTVEGLRQLAQVGAASEHSALLFVNIAAGFSETNLGSDSTTSLQCTGCRGPVTELQAGVRVCELFDCPGSQGSSAPAQEHFTVTADVSDETGTFEKVTVLEDFLVNACCEPGAWPQMCRSTIRRLLLSIFKRVTLAVELPLRSHARPLRMIVVSAEPELPVW